MNLPITPGLVLVVDDIEGNRILAELLLRRIGWEVVTLPDSASVLSFIAHTAVPEAMLIDVRMPGVLAGDALASLLRAQPHTAGLRLVGYTAHALPDEISSLLASGFDDVLIKPVLLADMARALPLAPVPSARQGTPLP
jgi:CheY-like chemotaxis protein